MDVKTWHPVHLGIFWLALAIFGLPTWLVLSLAASVLTERLRAPDSFEALPVVLAFLVVVSFVGLGMAVTMRWLESRPAKSAE